MGIVDERNGDLEGEANKYECYTNTTVISTEKARVYSTRVYDNTFAMVSCSLSRSTFGVSSASDMTTSASVPPSMMVSCWG
jgi:hypothetical protein